MCSAPKKRSRNWAWITRRSTRRLRKVPRRRNFATSDRGSMHSFPASPGDLLWWEWLLWAAGCWSVAGAAKFILRDFLGDLAGLLAFVSVVAGVFCALFGIVRLIRLVVWRT